ncbi:MAG: FHA domain-containing protein [Kineosporiaceae bacterium]
MASAGQFVRERIPVPASVPEAGRLVLELVSSSKDSQAEAAGPMTFRVVRRYRPTWATATGFLIAPLFVRHTEVCRVAVIEARIGAELLLEGAIDPELHDRLMQLGRVPEAARVSTLGPRPVPHALSPHSPPPAAAYPQASHPGGYEAAPYPPQPAPPAAPAPAPLGSHQPPAAPDRSLDLRDAARPIPPGMTPAGRGTGDEFADLIPPPLLPPNAPDYAPSGSGQPSPAPAGPAPAFQPLHPPAPESGNGSNGGGSQARLPSAFRSPRDAVQADDVLAAPAPSAPSQMDWAPAAAPAAPLPPEGFGPPPVLAQNLSRTPPTDAAPSRAQQITVTVDSGEESVVSRLLIIGRAPSRQPHEAHAALLTVNDPSLSVSKTHLAIEADGAGLWVVDRNSTNGTWIDEGRGALRPVPPNQRTPVPPGARVLIGERVLTFIRQNP